MEGFYLSLVSFLQVGMGCWVHIVWNWTYHGLFVSVVSSFSYYHCYALMFWMKDGWMTGRMTDMLLSDEVGDVRNGKAVI